MFGIRAFSIALLSSATLVLASPHQYSVDPAPLYIPDTAPTDIIADSYIVVFKNEVDTTAFDSHIDFVTFATGAAPLDGSEGGLRHVWNSQIIKGYAGAFSPEVVELIRHRPEVAYVEAEQAVYAHETQTQAPWGLGRISQRERVVFFPTYKYVKNAGEGVMIYVLDTGVFVDHTEFEGRARWGVTIPKDVDRDRAGHGTHVAGTIAAKTFGVAKHANITAVKVLYTESKGSLADVISGIKWAVEDAARLKGTTITGSTKFKGAVINMSLGIPKVSSALNNATENAIAAGVHIVVSAGNDNHDACLNSPASAPSAITVAASTQWEERVFNSNFGKCVDVFAPGEEIKSTTQDGYEEERTGTSMAAPHVAGLIAYFLSIYPHETFNPVFESRLYRAVHAMGLVQGYMAAYNMLPSWVSRTLPSPTLFEPSEIETLFSKELTPAEMKAAIIDLATKDALSDVKDSPNLLVFNNATTDRFW